jgi:hypothetical protein
MCHARILCSQALRSDERASELEPTLSRQAAKGKEPPFNGGLLKTPGRARTWPALLTDM